VRRCWELRVNLTSYDAAHIALAEALGIALVTADRRIAQSPGVRCPAEVLS
jgi:predicted nucleic acid-binding protein